MELDKDVIQTEFPDLKLNSRDGKKVIFSLDNDKNIIISKENEDVSYDSKVYEFNDIQNSVVWPKTPELPNRLEKLDLDSWNGVVDSNARDDLNNNRSQIQETVNSVVDYIINQRNFFTEFNSSMGDLKLFITKIINLSVAEYLHDNVETKYYSRDAVDKMMEKQNRRINNIQSNLHTHENLNGVYPPSYSGPTPTLNSDDKILNPASRAKLEKMKEANNG